MTIEEVFQQEHRPVLIPGVGYRPSQNTLTTQLYLDYLMVASSLSFEFLKIERDRFLTIFPNSCRKPFPNKLFNGNRIENRTFYLGYFTIT